MEAKVYLMEVIKEWIVYHSEKMKCYILHIIVYNGNAYTGVGIDADRADVLVHRLKVEM